MTSFSLPRYAIASAQAAATAGASTRELMHRMGHASMRAALIYQHATSERDREIADSIDKRISKHTRKPRRGREPRPQP